jgi:alpha-N-arabinofuranosidase
VPSVSAAAARGADGKVYVALANVHVRETATVTVTLAGAKADSVSGRIITARAINAINTFENPDAVKPAQFAGAKVTGTKLTAELPPKSVVMLELR